ncbi:hypothetical protein J4E82_006345 [Alternaria postmessia]|uniref:uncharacterized protein n=1 Tax=Alternaria postmessia TaxID=1187938 RepID=UPI002224F077|nr:uncharacterized protein J4E82_006345 [Alternaria postmessia]KAI5374849.1 hypothetical protein J4E82_006345 [Alternaria postmessia]
MAPKTKITPKPKKPAPEPISDEPPSDESPSEDEFEDKEKDPAKNTSGPRTYSQNKNTMKNQKRRQEATGTHLKELKAQTASNTAISKFVKVVVDAVRPLVENSFTESERAEIEKAVKIQAKNVQLAIQFASGRHPSQVFGSNPRAKRTYLDSPDKYYARQLIVFVNLMPVTPEFTHKYPGGWNAPDCVVPYAKDTYHVDNGLMKKLAADTDADFDWDDTELSNLGQPITDEEVEAITYEMNENAAGRISKQLWAEVQAYWAIVARGAAHKFNLLERSTWDEYVYMMTNGRFKTYLRYLDPSHTGKDEEDLSIEPQNRAAAIREAYNTSIFHGHSGAKIMEIDGDSNLPIPPISVAFSRIERVWIGIVFLAQKEGQFVDNAIQVAVKNHPLSLPAPFDAQRLDPRRFAVESIEPDEACKFLVEICQEDPPADEDDLKFFTKMQDRGLDLERGDDDKSSDSDDNGDNGGNNASVDILAGLDTGHDNAQTDGKTGGGKERDSG